MKTFLGTTSLVKKMRFTPVIASIALVATSWCSASQASVIKTVDAKSGPWQFVNGGLNTSFQYGDGDEQAPTIYSRTDGFNFTPGDSLVISYVSGAVTNDPHQPYVGPTGISNFVTNDGRSFSSKYYNHSDYDAHLMELSGTFANSAGAIVGTPFKVGYNRTMVIPVGASALQLGVIDSGYYNNSGALNIRVTEAVPEPETYALMLAGLGVLGFIARRRKSL